MGDHKTGGANPGKRTAAQARWEAIKANMEKKSGSNGVLKKSTPVELENEKRGGRWNNTILQATDSGNGVLNLSFAQPTAYEHPNKSTTVAKYELSNGVWTGQMGDRTPHSVGINWDNVQAVEGKTYDVSRYLKGKGLHWNSRNRRYER